MCPYEIMESPSEIETIVMYDRIWRNAPAIRFTQVIHEYLLGKSLPGQPANWLLVAQGLRFRDWRDSPGEGVRIAHRNYKVFMREYERMIGDRAGAIPPGFLISTIGEVTAVNPNLALSILRMVKDRGGGLECPLHLARAYRDCGLDRHALDACQEAVQLAPHSAAARLALGFLMFESRLDGWRDYLALGIKKAEAMSGFNVDHRELRRAASLLSGGREGS